MFINLFPKSAKGGFFFSGNEDEPVFRGYVLPDHPEFLVIFNKLYFS